MSPDIKPDAPLPAPPKKSDGGWAVGLLGSEVCFFLFMACLLKPIGPLSARDRREVWLLRGCWLGTLALAWLSADLLSHSGLKAAVTRCVIAAGSALLIWLVVNLQPDGYLQRHFFGVNATNWVWRPALGGVFFLTVAVVLLLWINGDEHSERGLIIPAAGAMGAFMTAGVLFREAFANFQRSRYAPCG